MDPLEKYLASIKPLVGYASGAEQTPPGMDASRWASLIQLQADFATTGQPQLGLELAFASMRIAWQGLPPDVRAQALAALEELAVTVAGAVGKGLGEVPVVGQILKMLVDVATIFAGANRIIKEQSKEATEVERNASQYKQFAAATHPTQWIYTAAKVQLFRDWRCSTLSKSCFRLRPCLVPLEPGDGTMIGWDPLPGPAGSCDDGKQYEHKGVFSDLDKMEPTSDSPICEAWVLFSALYYPFWSVNAANLWTQSTSGVMAPLAVFSPAPNARFDYPVRDPNIPLMRNQSLLLGDPISNLTADGGRASRRLAAFKKWFAAHLGAHKIDASFKQANDVTWSGVAFWRDKNDLIHVYAPAAKEGFSLDTPVARAPGYNKKAVNGEYRKVTVSPAAYNAISSMTRAFFTARAGFLSNRAAMIEYEKAGLATDFDPAVRSAVKAAAVPARKRAPPPPRQKKGGGGGAAAAAAGLAWLFLRK